MQKRSRKKGQVLVENIVFIVLNVVFLSILVIFLLNQSNGVALYEGIYSKQVALVVDAAKPNMIVKINMQKAKKISDKNGVSFDDVLKIENGYVLVSLSEGSSEKYHFFNDIEVSDVRADMDGGEFDGFYTLTFSEKT